ncbi:Alpha/beta hydrolase nvfD-like protein [Cladobotryum mycophilum]|uniref:Alpha/beta hydrolase nvfD-like protein n=1 Tax=Cladobotryum mycophilum TaxID=491253 RepID=A0ABR0SGV0_9HYPO
MSKPTFVLIPGAWHTPDHFDVFIQRLNKAGYPTRCEKLPSVDSHEPRKQSVTVDIEFVIKNILLPELEQGKDLIILAHSYGGWVAGAAPKGLSKEERSAAGLPGGVIGIIFMTAFVGGEGGCITGLVPDKKLMPWNLVDFDTYQMSIGEPGPEQIFYHNVTDKSLVESAIRGLKPHSYRSFDTPSPQPAWPDKGFDGRRAYVFCHEDRAIPVEHQKVMVEVSGKEFRTFDLEDADHSPFLSKTEEMLEIVDGLAREWSRE